MALAKDRDGLDYCDKMEVKEKTPEWDLIRLGQW